MTLPNIYQLVIFHRGLGCDDESATDEEQLERVLYFYPEVTPVRKQLSTVSMLESLIEFAKKFSKEDNPLETIHMQNNLWGFFQCEPSVYITVAVQNYGNFNKAGLKPSAAGLLSAIERFYSTYFSLHGSIAGSLAGGRGNGWEGIQLVHRLRKQIRKTKASLNQTRQDLTSLQHRAAATIAAEAAAEKHSRLETNDTEEAVTKEEEEQLVHETESLGIRDGVKSLDYLQAEVECGDRVISVLEAELYDALNGSSINIYSSSTSNSSCSNNSTASVSMNTAENKKIIYTPQTVARGLQMFVPLYISSGEFLAPSALHIIDGIATRCSSQLTHTSRTTTQLRQPSHPPYNTSASSSISTSTRGGQPYPYQQQQQPPQSPLSNLLKSVGVYDTPTATTATTTAGDNGTTSSRGGGDVGSSSMGGRLLQHGGFTRYRLRLQEAVELATHRICTGIMVIHDGQLLWSDLGHQTTSSLYRLLAMQEWSFIRHTLLQAKRGSGRWHTTTTILPRTAKPAAAAAAAAAAIPETSGATALTSPSSPSSSASLTSNNNKIIMAATTATTTVTAATTAATTATPDVNSKGGGDDNEEVLDDNEEVLVVACAAAAAGEGCSTESSPQIVSSPSPSSPSSPRGAAAAAAAADHKEDDEGGGDNSGKHNEELSSPIETTVTTTPMPTGTMKKKPSAFRKLKNAVFESMGFATSNSSSSSLTTATANSSTAAATATNTISISSGGGNSGASVRAAAVGANVDSDVEDQATIEESWAKAIQAQVGFIGSDWHTFDVTSLNEVTEQSTCASTTALPDIWKQLQQQQSHSADDEDGDMHTRQQQQSARDDGIKLWCPRVYVRTEGKSCGSSNECLCVGRALVYRQKRFLVVLMLPDWGDSTSPSGNLHSPDTANFTNKDSGLPVSLLKLCLSVQHGLSAELDQVESELVSVPTTINEESAESLLSFAGMTSAAAAFFAPPPPQISSSRHLVERGGGFSRGGMPTGGLTGVQVMYFNTDTQVCASSGLPKVSSTDVSLLEYPAPLGHRSYNTGAAAAPITSTTRTTAVATTAIGSSNHNNNKEGDTTQTHTQLRGPAATNASTSTATATASNSDILHNNNNSSSSSSKQHIVVVLSQPKLIAEVPSNFPFPPSLLSAAHHPRVARAMNDIANILALSTATGATTGATTTSSSSSRRGGGHSVGAREVCQLVHLGNDTVIVPALLLPPASSSSSSSSSASYSSSSSIISSSSGKNSKQKSTHHVWVVGRHVDERIVFYIVGADWDRKLLNSGGNSSSNAERGAAIGSSSSNSNSAKKNKNNSSGSSEGVVMSSLASPALSSVAVLHGSVISVLSSSVSELHRF